MIDAEERAARQRSFYLNLDPKMGQVLAHSLTGIDPPGEDSQESELRDSLRLWFRLHNAGVMPYLVDSAWWMTRFLDRNNRMSMEESTTRSGELVSYAVSTLGLLLDTGVLKFATEPAIPNFVTSKYDPDKDAIEKALLDRMEAAMKENTDE